MTGATSCLEAFTGAVQEFGWRPRGVFGAASKIMVRKQTETAKRWPNDERA